MSSDPEILSYHWSFNELSYLQLHIHFKKFTLCNIIKYNNKYNITFLAKWQQDYTKYK